MPKGCGKYSDGIGPFSPESATSLENQTQFLLVSSFHRKPKFRHWGVCGTKKGLEKRVGWCNGMIAILNQPFFRESLPSKKNFFFKVPKKNHFFILLSFFPCRKRILEIPASGSVLMRSTVWKEQT